MQSHDCDVAVVGGGPAGVDRASFPRDKVCGDFVGPMALAELADLGVTELDGFGATAAMGTLALHVDADRPALLGIPQVDGVPGYGRVIPRLQLDAWIVEAARRAGATVLPERKAEAVLPSADAVTVRGGGADGPWQLRARLLLGADGSNSMVARTLRGGPPPGRNRITAVRAYFDDVAGPEGQGDVWFRGDTFPGYHWLFPAAGGLANVGVGMLVSTYPQSARNLRDMLERLIAQDASIQRRLRGARMRGKILGHPLTTYDPAQTLVGERIMLLGDAAGLINPLNGEGIQYALHSACWAAGVAADRLDADRLDAASLNGYAERVRLSLRADMALSRLIVQLFRNRELNQVWLGALRSIAARAVIDPDYAHAVGCVLTGLPRDVSSVGPGAAARIFGRAMISPLAGASWQRLRQRRSGRPAPGAPGAPPAPPAPGELRHWTGGTGRALAEFAAQLTPAAVTRRR